MERVAGFADRLDQRRRDAWQTGRDRSADLAEQYRQRYRLPVAPPPAKIVYELITDFVGVELHFDPLPLDRYAQTRWVHGEPTVTINSLTSLMSEVKHVDGVQRVAAFHELMHVMDDGDMARGDMQASMPGLDEPIPIVCYREPNSRHNRTLGEREFRAEEGGRAAAIPIWALERVAPWRELQTLASRRPDREVVGGWPRLFACAEALGVNVTSLIKQLSYEGRLVVVRAERGADKIYVPASFGEVDDGWK